MMSEKWKDQVEFVTVYVREAHPVGENRGATETNRPFLICDDVYRYLLANRNGSLGTVRQLLEDGIVYCGAHEAQYFQLPQILELPFVLETIATHCDALTKETVNMVQEAVIHLYHQHWKLIMPHVSLDIVARLVA